MFLHNTSYDKLAKSVEFNCGIVFMTFIKLSLTKHFPLVPPLLFLLPLPYLPVSKYQSLSILYLIKWNRDSRRLTQSQKVSLVSRELLDSPPQCFNVSTSALFNWFHSVIKRIVVIPFNLSLSWILNGISLVVPVQHLREFVALFPL